MGNIDAGFKGEITRYDQPLVIASNRASAILLGVRLRWQAGGYPSGTVLARNTTDGLYQAYASGGASGTGTAACILWTGRKPEDFDGTAATSSTVSQGIFGGCTVYKDRLTGYDAAALTALKGTEIIDASGTSLIKF